MHSVPIIEAKVPEKAGEIYLYGQLYRHIVR
jgi:hypothetical protein